MVVLKWSQTHGRRDQSARAFSELRSETQTRLELPGLPAIVGFLLLAYLICPADTA